MCKQMNTIKWKYLCLIAILETISLCANKWALTICLKVKLPTNHMYTYVCVCVCVCEREREREWVCVCVCVCKHDLALNYPQVLVSH